MSDATGILIPADEEMRLPELDPLLECGVASRPSDFNTSMRVEIDKPTLNWFFAVAFACKLCQIGAFIWREHSDIHHCTRALDLLPKQLINTMTKLWRL
jgi:hypothetical protein